MLCFSTDGAETESLLTNSSAPTDCASWQDGNRKSSVCVSILKTDQTNCNLHTVMSNSYKEKKISAQFLGILCANVWVYKHTVSG